MFRSTLKREAGTMQLPEAPGLGVDFDEDGATTFPPPPRDYDQLARFRRPADGSVGTVM